MSNNNNRNSNSNNNNRRRGRGNNRSQGGGNLNRVDSRARGNAPQLLEKYKKLAHDASLNGDRVQAEYYLQFADHYFRVLADSRTPKDETRGPRREFDQRSEDEEDFEEDFDRGSRQQPQRSRRDEVSDDRDEARNGDNKVAAEAPAAVESAPEAQSDEAESAENPFTRESRLKPRRGRRERAAERGDDDGDAANAGLDPSALPPAIGREEASESAEAAEAPEEKPAPRRRRTRARSSDDDQALEVVS